MSYYIPNDKGGNFSSLIVSNLSCDIEKDPATTALRCAKQELPRASTKEEKVYAQLDLAYAYARILIETKPSDRTKLLKEFAQSVNSLGDALTTYKSVNRKMRKKLAKVFSRKLQQETYGKPQARAYLFFGLGKISFVMQDFNQAAGCFEASLGTVPGDAITIAILLETYKVLLAKNMKTPKRYLYSGKILELTGQKRRAVSAYIIYLQVATSLSTQERKTLTEKIGDMVFSQYQP